MTTVPPHGAKVVIVTGASHGIGAGVAMCFRRAGYAVVVNSRSIAQTDDHDLLAVQGDISEPATAQLVVDEALDRFGRIDTLINNAGLYMSKRFTEYTPGDFAAMLSVNLAGFFHITQRVIRQFVVQRRGHVVNITTSLVDHARSSTPSALTSLTKGGVDGVTRSLAIEYAAAGIRVNAVAPGVVKTPERDPASYRSMADSHPLGRVAEIEDIVEGILYLERASFVTGETLRIDGGQAAGH